MMTEKIKPCPFCGETKPVFISPVCSVRCASCGAVGPSGMKQEEAILLWNAAANALEAAQAKARDVLDAHTTVIAARDEDERLYQDEITRLERQVATLEQQLQTELDMRNTHAVEEVARLENEVTRLDGEITTLVETYNFRIREYAQIAEYSDRRIAELYEKCNSFEMMWLAAVKERNEARHWAAEYKRRLVAAAKAMRGDGND